MYSSGYSQVSMRSPQIQKKMQYHSKGKSCGYYMRIVFFFSSLIQSLIIISLVLFLIYGKKQDSASVSRIQDLEESFSRLSIDNAALKQQRKNLTTLLNSTLIEKARNDWDLAVLRYLSNGSVVIIDDFRNKLKQCSEEVFSCKSRALLSGPCPQILQGSCNCGLLLEQLKARHTLVESNFTHTTQRMSREMDQIAKERDNLNLQAISLRRDKFTQEKEVEFCRQKCKDDFAQSLSGISNVTKAFLEKVDSLFPAHIAFQLTCPKQREHLEQIRTNCSSLSRDVEDKFQRYLNSVGEQVSSIQAESSRLKAENWRLSDDYRWCSQNRTGMIHQHKQNLDKLQRKHDDDKERLLIDKMKLNGEIQVLDNSVKYKSKEAEHLREQLKQLNMSCVSKTGFGGFPGGSASRTSTSQSGWGMFGGGGSSSASSSSTGGGQPGRTGSGSSFGSGSAFNKLSTGTGSSSTSLSSAGSSSSTGFGFNKPGSTGIGSSSTSLSSAGSSSSTGFGFNKIGSTGAGSSSTSLSSPGSGSSTGLGYNKPGSTGGAFPSFGSTGSNPNLSSSATGSIKPATSGKGSSSFGSSSVSTGSSPNLSSSGTGSNKPPSNGKSSSASGSSSGSTGSSSKSGSSSSGFSWLGFGSSSPSQSKTGSGTGKGTSSGSSSSGTGSIFGGGRTSGLGVSSVSVTQHLQDLQRLINPARPEDKQDLSRILG